MAFFSFSAEIFILDINPYVYLPENILQEIFREARKDKGPIPVQGTLNGKDFTQTLVKYKGAWRLYLNGIMRKAAGIDVGDTVQVEIAFNPKPKKESMPAKFSKALSANKEVKEEFEKLAPYRKKEILRYLNSMKTQESLERNITKVIQHLLGKKPVGLYALMRRKP